MTLRVAPLPGLPEVLTLESQPIADERGWFMEGWRASELRLHGIATHFVQESHSGNLHAHTLRGLHYQAEPASQGKIVRCTAGAVFDVAVDVRPTSPTRGRWASRILDHPRCALWIPPGFAHGYVTLTPATNLHYLVSGAEYAPHLARTLRWDDPALGIPWPVQRPVVSPRDREAPTLADLTG